MRSAKFKSWYSFPPVEESDENGLLAFGGDLSAERLISAYESGIFPWYEAGQPILWWSPPQRMLLLPGQFKVSKSLRQIIRKEKYSVSIDTAFGEVIQQCAKIKRKGQDNTWITSDMQRAYIRLHEAGFAHSVECWLDGKLAGGLYGVSLGKAFFGESMFSAESDASKIALYHLCQFASEHGFHFIDCQLHTSHLASLGAKEVERSQFLKLLGKALDYPDIQEKWSHIG